MEEAELMPGWLQEMRIGEHTPETEEYGIGSFVYRARRPFDGLKLRRFLDSVFVVCEGITDKSQEAHRRNMAVDAADLTDTSAAQRDGLLSHMKANYGNLLRSKGTFWVESRNHLWGHWSHAGVLLRVGAGGLWNAELPREEWGETEEERAAVEKLFEGEDGDRRTEIVLIGQGLKKEAIVKALDDCLAKEADSSDTTESDSDQEEQGVEADGFQPWPTKEDILNPPPEEEGSGHEHGHAHAPAAKPVAEAGEGGELDDGEEV